MARIVRLIDLNPKIYNAYADTIGALLRATEAGEPVVSKGVLKAYRIGLDAHMRLQFINDDERTVWRGIAQITVNFLGDIASECKNTAYRTAPVSGKLTPQGARLLDAYEALEALKTVLDNMLAGEEHDGK